MRPLVLPLLFLLALAGLAGAQDSKANAFIGFSLYGRSPLSGEYVFQYMPGVEASAEVKALPLLGVVGDFNEYAGGKSECSGPAVGPSPALPISGFSCSPAITGEEHFLFGPRLSKSFPNVRPFGEALFGVAHATGNSGLSSPNSFATALGVGMDVKVFYRIAVRFQGDYVQTRFYGGTQNGFRLTTGFVFRFGGGSKSY
jgi:hypothetical protein